MATGKQDKKTYATNNPNVFIAKWRRSSTSTTSNLSGKCRLVILKHSSAEIRIKESFLAAVQQPDMMADCQMYNLHLSFKYEGMENQNQNIAGRSPVKSDFRAFHALLWVHWHSTGNCKHSHWINYHPFPPRSVWLLQKKRKINSSELWSACREPACQLV